MKKRVVSLLLTSVILIGMISLADGLAAYSMNDDGTAGEMIVTEDVSDTLNNINRVIIASSANPGTIPETIHIHTPELQEGLLPTYDASGFMPYYRCTDETCGRYFEDEACATEITDIDAWKAENGNGYLAPLEKPEYIIIAGENSKWTKGSEDSLVISCSGLLNELAGVYMDGKLIDESCYNKYPGYIGLEISEDNLGELHGQTMTLKNTTSAAYVIGLVLGLVIDDEQLSELFGQCEKIYVCNPEEISTGGLSAFMIPGKLSESSELVKLQLGHFKIHTFDNFELPAVKKGLFIIGAPISFDNEAAVGGRVALTLAIKIGEQKGLVGDEVITSPVHPGAYVGGGSMIHIIDNHKDPKRAAIFSPYSYSSNDIDLSDLAFTDIELKPEYLETLAVGNHTLKLVYKDGTEVSTNMEIAAKTDIPTSPRTGDTNNMTLWIVLMLVSATALCVCLIFGKRKRTVK